MLIVIESDRAPRENDAMGAPVQKWWLSRDGLFYIRLLNADKSHGCTWLAVSQNVMIDSERFGTLTRLLYGHELTLIVDATAFRKGGGHVVPRPNMKLPETWGRYWCYDRMEYIQMAVWWMLRCMDVWHTSDGMGVIWYPKPFESMSLTDEFRFGPGSVYMRSRIHDLIQQHLLTNNLARGEMAYDLRLPFSDRQAVGTQESATGGERDNDCEREDRDELLG